MNNKHVSGAVNDVKGKIKEEVGHATGNNKMEGEGIVDQIKGKIEKSLGDAKDAVKNKIDQVLDKDTSRSA